MPRCRNITCKNKGINIYLKYILIWGQIMKTAKLFQNGQSQAVRLPKEFRFDDSEVFIKKTGNVVQLIPRSDSWNSLFGSLEKFSSDFMVDRVQPELDKRESF
jgi:antitoxin VapB